MPARGGVRDFEGHLPIIRKKAVLNPPFRERVSLLAAALLGIASISSCGGGSSSGASSSEVAAGWGMSIPNAPLPAFAYTQTLLRDGRVIVIGGWTSDAVVLADAVIYDPSTDTWAHAASMPTPRAADMAVLLSDGRVLVAGGGVGLQDQTTSTALLYDPTTDRWSPTGSMTTPAPYIPYSAVAVLLGNGNVLVAGVYSCPNCSSSSASYAEVYDPVQGTWTSAAAPLFTWGNPDTATLLSNGKVLVTGGSVLQDGLDLPELYDPVSDSWSAIPTGEVATFALAGRIAISLQNGTVLLAGGSQCCGENPTVATAEIYDPQANTFTPAADMLAARSGAAAALLPNGKVFITGGAYTFLQNDGYQTDFLQSSELYDPGNGSTAAGNMPVSGDGVRGTLVKGAFVVTGQPLSGVQPVYALYHY